MGIGMVPPYQRHETRLHQKWTHSQDNDILEIRIPFFPWDLRSTSFCLGANSQILQQLPETRYILWRNVLYKKTFEWLGNLWNLTTELYVPTIQASDATRIISRSSLHVQSSSWLFVEKFEPSPRKLSSWNAWHSPRTPENLPRCGSDWWKMDKLLGRSCRCWRTLKNKEVSVEISLFEMGFSLRCMS